MALRLAAVCLLLLLAPGCGGNGKSSSGPCPSNPVSLPATNRPPPWPAPSNPIERTCAAGLVPERAEFLQYHVHAHLDVFVNGKRVRVPAGIGINTKDPGVKSGTEPDGTTAYGNIELCDKPCISPLHTHADDGILHTETKTVKPNKLGQFFIQWGVRLDRNCVAGYCKPKVPLAVYINGKRYQGDPRDIELSDLTEIAIVIGKPPTSIPSRFPL